MRTNKTEKREEGTAPEEKGSQITGHPCGLHSSTGNKVLPAQACPPKSGMVEACDGCDRQNEGVSDKEEPSNITTEHGLIYRDGVMVPVPEADNIASEFGFVYAEQLVRHLEGKTCKHNKAMDGYCKPCGRIHGG